MADEPDKKEGIEKELAAELAQVDASDDEGMKLPTDTSVEALATASPVQPSPKRRGRPPKSASAKLAATLNAGSKSAKASAKTAAPKPKAKAPKPAKPTKPVSAPAVVAKKPRTAPKAAPKTAPAAVNAAKSNAVTPPIRKEPNTMDMSANYSTFQDTMSEAQAKAKEAFEKTTGMFGEASEFAKGNVEAMIESGKIFSEGVQEMGTTMAAEGKAAFETMSADMKELAAVRSPTDFFKLQGEMMRKNFDSAVAYGSKNSEAMLKLMSDSMAPLSGRVSMAVEKARQTAI